MLVVFVHGWSVTSKDTYGGLPEALQAAAAAAGLAIETREISLGRYISFHDEVTLDDLAHAMDHAVRNDLPGNADARREFACITHSTGGPLVRRWVDLHYGADHLAACPLRQLVMLAPANHGSALAALGKSRVGRINAWYNGVEPGQGVLDWLCLGSAGAWELQTNYIAYPDDLAPLYPFVLTGETIDHAFYDFLNSYLVEKGSDGVVRVAAANLNYAHFRLVQSAEVFDDVPERTTRLVVDPDANDRAPPTAFGVIPDASHSGDKIGIMRSVTPANAAAKPVVAEIVRCLQVTTPAAYARRVTELAALTERTQAAAEADGTQRRFIMFVVRVRDDAGRTIDDYDLFLLGDAYRPDAMPQGFFVDKQKNALSSSLVYYMDYDILARADQLGIRVVARPRLIGGGAHGFAGYVPAEYRSDGADLVQALRPNETVYLDIVLKRYVNREAFRLDPLSAGKGDFKKTTPSGENF